MSHAKVWILAGALAVPAAAWALWPTQGYSDDSNVEVRLRPRNPQFVELGKRIYLEHCAECHGSNLEGQPNWRRRDAEGYLPAPPHDATGHTWHHADQLLFDITKFGTAKLVGPAYKTRMAAYEGVLSDREIVAVLSFIKSHWPEQLQRRHDRMNEARQQR